jgi:phenylpyruvate tautomerase PptA (4-oxalocrotonate tautomerase family)
MPVTLTLSEGLMSEDAAATAFAGLTKALLKVAGLEGNPFMEPNVVGTLNVLPRAHVFTGGQPGPAAFVELKLPGIALATSEAKQAFIEQATAVVETAAEGRLRRDQIWVNIVYAADGAWGIAGKAYSDADLVTAVQGAAARGPAGRA